MPEVPTLTQSSARERLKSVPEEAPPAPAPEEPKTIPVVGAFLVVKTLDNNYGVIPDINAPVEVQRELSRDEIKSGASCVADDMRTMEVAEVTVQTFDRFMQQKQQQAMASMEAAKTQQAMASGAIKPGQDVPAALRRGR